MLGRPGRHRVRRGPGEDRMREAVDAIIGRTKNPHAVGLGRLGGLKGGPAGGRARAAALSAKRRRQIVGLAAAARWGVLPDLLRPLFPGYRLENFKMPHGSEPARLPVLT